VWWFVTLPETIELMGNKVATHTFCIENDFPLAPSETEADAGKNFAGDAWGIGVPPLIKAAAGGGGKGMHIVRIKDLAQAIELPRGRLSALLEAMWCTSSLKGSSLLLTHLWLIVNVFIPVHGPW